MQAWRVGVAGAAGFAAAVWSHGDRAGQDVVDRGELGELGGDRRASARWAGLSFIGAVWQPGRLFPSVLR